MTLHRALPLYACAIAATVAMTGCSKKAAPPPAESTPDLSQAMDLFQNPVSAGAPMSPTTVVAVVDGAEVTARDVERQANALLAGMRNRLPPEQLAQLQPRIREQAINQVIARQLLVKAVETEGITASPEEIAEARKKIEDSLPEGMTLETLLQMRNVTVEEFEKEFAQEFKVNKLIEQKTADAVAVSDEEARAFYDENPAQFQQPELVTARHILVAVEPNATEEDKAAKKAEAEGIRARLVGGEDFAAVAAVESDDPGSKNSGGEYTFPRGQMVPPFEEAAFTQPIGEIGPLVETQFGYHIIRVDERKDARTVPYDEVGTNIASYLKMRKIQTAAQSYIEGLRSNAQVHILSP